MANLKVFSQRLVGVSEENHDELQGNCFPGRDLIPGLPHNE
jgi:hypothetical protein